MNSLTKHNTKVGLYAFLAFALICLAAFLPVTAHAATYTVDPGGTGDYTTIQDAIDAGAVVDGDILSIVADTYVITSTITIDKALTLQGADEATTIVEAGADLTYMIDIPNTVTGVTISGLTMEGAAGTFNVQSAINAAAPLTLSDVTVQNISHDTNSVFGIYLLDDSSLTNLTMSNIGRFGIYADATAAAAAISLAIDGLDYTGKNLPDEIDYAVSARNGVQMTMTNSSIVDCSGTPDIYASAAVVGSTTTSAPATTDIQITDSDFSNNFINIGLGMGAAENGTTASASGCDFNITTGGYQIDTYSASTLNFENNYWNTTSASEIESTFNIIGAGAVDYVPYYMDATMTTTTDDYLQDLAFSAGTLDATFDAGDLAPSVTVPYANSSITVTPTAFDGAATITVDGNTVASGATSAAVALGAAGSDTVITVVVNGTVTYTITAHRQTSYRLSALTVNQGGGGSAVTLTPAFDPDTHAYNFLVTGAYTTVDIAATAEDAGGATVTGDTGASLALSGSPFTITCESSEGVTQDYTLTAVYPSSDASLSDLQLNGSTVTGFAPTTYTYAQTVSNVIASAVFTVTPTDAFATYTINGAAAAASYALSEGDNVFTILVTAQDGVTQSTYTVTVTREAATSSTNANLSALSVNGTAVSGFDASVTSYTVAVPNTSTTATVAATAEDASATIAGTGTVTLSTTVTTTNVSVVVTAADGTTTKTYSLLLVKTIPGEASLLTLTFNGTQVGGFSSTTYSYSVRTSLSSVNIGAVATDLAATVTGTGVKSLSFGANVFTITVTSSDGTATRNYLLTITRTGYDDATLSDIKVNGVTLTDFDSEKVYYYGYVNYNDTTATLAATASSSGATITGTGTFSVNAGENLHYITVTAPDGTTKKNYRVTVVRPLSTWPHLRNLTLNGVTIDNFAYHNYEYVTKLPATASTVTIGATPFNSTTTVTGTGAKSLVRGGNDLTVRCVSISGTVREYDMTIFRGYLRDATLRNITIDGSVISGFSSDDTYYTLTVPYSTKGFTFWGKPTDDYASISGNGWKNLSVGTNTLKLVVTADDDTTTKTYTVVVTRKSSTSGSSSGTDDDDDDDDDDDSNTDDSDTDTDDTDDDTSDTDTDTDTPVVVNPTSEVDVTEDVLLKDTTNEMDGTTFILIVDDDAFLDAITNALAKKRIEEGDGSNGILAHPYVSFPKANSVDASQSVKVKLDGAAVQSAFSQEVGLILTLDNYKIVIQPKSFTTDLVDDEVEDYLIFKRILEEEDISEAQTTLGSERNVIYAADAGIGYITENGFEGTQKTFDKPINVSVMLDSTVAAEIEAAESMTDIALFVEDSTSGNLMAVSYQYESGSRTLQFSTKSLGRILLTRAVAAEVSATAAPTEVPAPAENDSSSGFPPILIIIMVGAAILLIVIVFLLIRRARGGSSQVDDNGDINI